MRTSVLIKLYEELKQLCNEYSSQTFSKDCNKYDSEVNILIRSSNNSYFIDKL